MTTVNDLHPKAMDLAEEAFQFQRLGDNDRAKELFLLALALEQEAAMLLPPTEESEPSRSILFRSAASLAYNGEKYETAERLIAHGLIGFPPLEIQEELKDLYEDINFKRHLKAHGITLSKNQWVMTIHGNATSFGGTLVEPLMTRVENITTLFYRTIERLLGVDYRVSGSTKKEIKDAYGLYVNAFAPSSFAVSFQIGTPRSQMLLFVDDQPKETIEPDFVVDELMKCLELWENKSAEDLKDWIQDETYYQNFVGIAKQIAPDGDDVKLVGFKAIREGKEKPLTLRKSPQQVRETFNITKVAEKQSSRVELRGVLRFASSPLSKSFGTVHLLDAETAHQHIIKVPIAIMKDVVKPFYEERVIIVAFRKGNKLILDDISPDK